MSYNIDSDKMHPQTTCCQTFCVLQAEKTKRVQQYGLLNSCLGFLFHFSFFLFFFRLISYGLICFLFSDFLCRSSSSSSASINFFSDSSFLSLFFFFFPFSSSEKLKNHCNFQWMTTVFAALCFLFEIIFQ